MKQSFLAITLCLAILFGLTACSKGSVNISDPTTSTPVNNTGISDAGNETEEDANSATTTASSSTETTTTEAPIQNTTTKVNTPTTTKKPVVTTTKQQTPTTTAKPASQWDLPARGNEELLKQRIIYYINEYRAKEGTPKVIDNQTPAMQRFADLRAIDITVKFAHDQEMQMASAQKAKFGQLAEDSRYDPETNQVIYTGEKKYFIIGGEAIGQAHNGSIDDAAKSAADGVYESKGHWAYIGSSKYQYMVAGVQYNNGVWYIALECCNETNLQYAK